MPRTEESTRERGSNWGMDEMRMLLEVRADAEIDSMMMGTSRDSMVYQKIATRLGQMGIHRTRKQVTCKLQNVKKKFLVLKDQNWSIGEKRKYLHHYDICRSIWGHYKVKVTANTKSRTSYVPLMRPTGLGPVGLSSRPKPARESFVSRDFTALQVQMEEPVLSSAKRPRLTDPWDATDFAILLEENHKLKRKIVSLEQRLRDNDMKNKVASLEQKLSSAVDITDFQCLLEDTLAELKKKLLVNRRPLVLNSLNRIHQNGPRGHPQSESPSGNQPNILMGQRSDHSGVSEGEGPTQPGQSELQSIHVVKMEWDVDNDEGDGDGQTCVPRIDSPNSEEEVDIHQSRVLEETNLIQRHSGVGAPSPRKTGDNTHLTSNSKKDVGRDAIVPSHVNLLSEVRPPVGLSSSAAAVSVDGAGDSEVAALNVRAAGRRVIPTIQVHPPNVLPATGDTQFQENNPGSEEQLQITRIQSLAGLPLNNSWKRCPTSATSTTKPSLDNYPDRKKSGMHQDNQGMPSDNSSWRRCPTSVTNPLLDDYSDREKSGMHQDSQGMVLLKRQHQGKLIHSRGRSHSTEGVASTAGAHPPTSGATTPSAACRTDQRGSSKDSDGASTTGCSVKASTTKPQQEGDGWEAGLEGNSDKDGDDQLSLIQMYEISSDEGWSPDGNDDTHQADMTQINEWEATDVASTSFAMGTGNNIHKSTAAHSGPGAETISATQGISELEWRHSLPAQNESTNVSHGLHMQIEDADGDLHQHHTSTGQDLRPGQSQDQMMLEPQILFKPRRGAGQGVQQLGDNARLRAAILREKNRLHCRRYYQRLKQDKEKFRAFKERKKRAYQGKQRLRERQRERQRETRRGHGENVVKEQPLIYLESPVAAENSIRHIGAPIHHLGTPTDATNVYEPRQELTKNPVQHIGIPIRHLGAPTNATNIYEPRQELAKKPVHHIGAPIHQLGTPTDIAIVFKSGREQVEKPVNSIGTRMRRIGTPISAPARYEPSQEFAKNNVRLIGPAIHTPLQHAHEAEDDPAGPSWGFPVPRGGSQPQTPQDSQSQTLGSKERNRRHCREYYQRLKLDKERWKAFQERRTAYRRKRNRVNQPQQ